MKIVFIVFRLTPSFVNSSTSRVEDRTFETYEEAQSYIEKKTYGQYVIDKVFCVE